MVMKWHHNWDKIHHISIKSIKQLHIRNRPAPSFCSPIVIPKLMMSLPGPPTRAGIFDKPGWLALIGKTGPFAGKGRKLKPVYRGTARRTQVSWSITTGINHPPKNPITQRKSVTLPNFTSDTCNSPQHKQLFQWMKPHTLWKHPASYSSVVFLKWETAEKTCPQFSCQNSSLYVCSFGQDSETDGHTHK